MAKDFGSVTRRLNDVIKDVGGRTRIRATAAAYDIQFVQRFKFRDGKLASVQIIAANSV